MAVPPTAQDAEPALLQQVRAEAAALLGAASTVTGVRLVQRRPGTVVLLLAVDGDPHGLVLKLTDADGDVRRTATVLSTAHAAGVPVPEVVAAGPSVTRPGWQCLLSSRVEGLPWQAVRPRLSPAELATAHGELAQVALALRDLRFPGSAPLPAVEALRRRADLRIRDPRRRAVLAEVLDEQASAFSAEPSGVLCHDDLHSANVLFRPTPSGWRLSGVLDWDKAWSGPADSDVARMAFWDDMTGPGFWAVYRAAVPVSDGEDVRLQVHQLLWCLEHEDPSPRHTADTAGLCRRLGVRPPGPS